MQILSQPLRPSTSSTNNLLFGGGVGVGTTSPPLLERRHHSSSVTPTRFDIDIELLEAEEELQRDNGRNNNNNNNIVNIQIMEQDGIMDSLQFDEHGIPTVFYLNVDNLDTPNGDDGSPSDEIMGLNSNHHNVHLVSTEDEPFTHHYSLQDDGTIQYHHHPQHSGGNSISNGGIDFTQYENNTLGDDEEEGEHAFEFEEITTMPLTSDQGSELNHFQLRLQPSSSSSLTFPFTVVTTTSSSSSSLSSTASNNGTLLLRQHLAPQQQSNNTTAQKRKLLTSSRSISQSDPLATTSSPVSPPEHLRSLHAVKRPKLVVNLYEPETGYEFGCLLKDNTTTVSHLIPYKEDYILRCLDREEIPFKALRHLNPLLKWRRGHLLAQVRDYRRFCSTTQNSKPHGPVLSSKQRGILPPKTVKRCNPVITELILRPTTQSILSDFEEIVSRATKAWGRKRGLQNEAGLKRPISSSSEDDEEDDDFGEDSDYDVDLIPDKEEVGGDGEHENGREELNYEDRLELEKEFVNKTSGPLCLDPSPRVALIQNRIQFERLKWRCPSLTKKRRLTSPTEDESSSFSQFVQNIRDKSNKDLILNRKEDPLKLFPTATSHHLPFVEYPLLQPPTSMEEILKLGPKPEPCTIRPLPIDNFVKKIEEYTLETERRKRPHTTKLSIFQRNGMDAYFGELEMESIQESGSSTPKLGFPVLPTTKDGLSASTSTKCQFELGSSQSVALYVKQFSDIFTEDGRRPCKITYQKVGQPAPQVLYTNSYNKTGSNATVVSSSASSSPVTPTPSTSSTPSSAASSNNNTQAVVASPTTPATPPVQIVHPQPRSTPNSGDGTPLINSTGQPQTQQILTRPPPQQQPLQTQIQNKPVGPTNIPTASASHQHLLQQRLLRLKQQQQQQQQQAQQQQQQPQTALAKLLLTNTTNSSSTIPTSSRPITVAVQPQPQKVNNMEAQQHQGQNVNLNLSTGTGGQNHVSLNLNTMMLDGLLQGGQNQLLRGGNILRVNQSVGGNHVVVSSSGSSLTSTSTSSAALQRLHHTQYITTPNTTAPTNLSSLLQHHPQQRILINANNGQQLTLSDHHHQLDSSEQLPDLSSLLSSSHHHTILSTSSAPPPTQHHHHQDTHNLNLNLNLNLNSTSSGLDSSSLNPQPPPFLVFISPIRSVPVSINATTSATGVNRPPSLLQQQLNAGPQPLSLSLENHHSLVSSSSSNDNNTTLDSGGSEFYTMMDTSGGGGSEIKLEPTHHPPNTVMIGNTAYSLNVSSSSNNNNNNNNINSSSSSGGQDVITLSSLLGSSNKPVGSIPSTPTTPLILHQGGNQQGIVVSSSNASLLSSTPRLSALLAGTPSADSTSGGGGSTLSGLLSPGRSSITLGGGGGHPGISPGNNNKDLSSNRSLLDRLAASLGNTSHTSIPSSSPSSSTPSIRTGLNPIASATPNVVLDHPVLAATLTGQQNPQTGQSPKLVSAYRQIAPAPLTNSSPSSRGKHP